MKDGVSVAARGLLLFFSSYMAVNVVQSKDSRSSRYVSIE